MAPLSPDGGMSERLACEAVGPARSCFRRILVARTPELRSGYATIPLSTRATGFAGPGRQAAAVKRVPAQDNATRDALRLFAE
jgi:hypothetical protein